jgi:hypothetical protein
VKIQLNALTNPNKLITAIKGYRAVTGRGLKESKDAVDSLRGGAKSTIEVASYANAINAVNVFREHGIEAEVIDLNVSETVLCALRRMPRYLTVIDVIDVLEAVEA